MKSHIPKEYWFVATTGILSGLIVFGGQVFKNYGFSLLELSVLVYLPCIIFLLPYLRGKRSEIFDRQNMKLLLIWSLVASLEVICQFGAIVAGAPVVLVVLLLYTQPIWTIIISRVFYKISITKLDIAALLLVFFGVLILVNPWNIHHVGNIVGVIIALMGGVALAGWVTVGNYVGKSKIDPYVAKFMEVFLETFLITLILILISIVIKRPEIIKFSLNWPLSVWILIIIWCLLTQVMGHVLYLKGSKVVPAKEAGIIMLLEPLSGAILAALFLGQLITLNILIGGILILAANYLVITNKKRVEEHSISEIN